MQHLAEKTESLRMIILLVAAVILVGWLVSVCKTHQEDCHAHCVCAMPCCQAAVLTSGNVSTVELVLTGTLPVADQQAHSHTLDPILRPPKA